VTPKPNREIVRLRHHRRREWLDRIILSIFRMENPETGIRLVVGKEDAQYVQGAVTVRRLFRRRHDQEYWTTGRVIRRADQSIVDHQSAVLKLVADESSGRRSRKFLASAQKRPPRDRERAGFFRSPRDGTAGRARCRCTRRTGESRKNDYRQATYVKEMVSAHLIRNATVLLKMGL